jgi:hypothetical protein
MYGETIMMKETNMTEQQALKIATKKDSHHSLNKCNNAIKKFCELMGYSIAAVQNDIPEYLRIRNMITDFAKKI